METTTDPDSFEARKERFLRRVAMLEAQARTLLRTFGPPVGRPHDEDFAVRNCRKCNPPPELYRCPSCAATFEHRWRYKLHLDTNPKWCQDRMRATARNFSREA